MLTYSLTWKLETEAWQRGDLLSQTKARVTPEAVKAFLGPLFWLPHQPY